MKTLFSIDKLGNEKIIGNYDLYPQNYDGHYQIYDPIPKKFGLISNKGNVIIECEMDAIDFSICYGTIYVKKNGLYGYFDTMGNCIIECRFGSALKFCGNIAAVKNNYTDIKYYLITKDGVEIPTIKVDYLSNPFENKLISFQLENKYGFINNFGECPSSNQCRFLGFILILFD